MLRFLLQVFGVKKGFGVRRRRRIASPWATGSRRIPPLTRHVEQSWRTKAQQSEPRLKDDKPDYPVPDFPESGELVGRAYVIDGDTIAISRIKIRISGIDAPELDRPWGKKAKWALVNICKGQVVTAKLNGERSYDRLVGTCYLPDGTDIGAEMVRRGEALDWDLFSGGKYRHLEPEDARQRLLGFGARQH
jgi:endonuclease YncB( thermonuclease family)